MIINSYNDLDMFISICDYLSLFVPSFSAMLEIVTAAWALVVHECDVKAGHVIETISSKYSRIPASVPEKKKQVNSQQKQLLICLFLGNSSTAPR